MSAQALDGLHTEPLVGLSNSSSNIIAQRAAPQVRTSQALCMRCMASVQQADLLGYYSGSSRSLCCIFDQHEAQQVDNLRHVLHKLYSVSAQQLLHRAGCFVYN